MTKKEKKETQQEDVNEEEPADMVETKNLKKVGSDQAVEFSTKELPEENFSNDSNETTLEYDNFQDVKRTSSRRGFFNVIIFVVLAFMIGFVWGGKNQRSKSPIANSDSVVSGPLSLFGDSGNKRPENVNFDVFWEAWREMDRKFVDTDKLDSQERVYGAIRGMVSAAGDPYSAYMDPEETKAFNTDMEGSFEGIGAELGMKDGMLTVIAPLEGMPAEKAGLRAGDKIVKIYDEITIDMSIDDAVKKIRGKKGTEVILTVSREETRETKEIKIVRGHIELKSVKYEKKEGNIGHIKITKFVEDTGDEFHKAMVTAITDNVNGVVVDVRNNPGGYLNVAVDIISTFVTKGEVVVWEKGRDNEKASLRAHGGDKLSQMPVVVLMNEGSASASEILAGALRDIRGVKLIGKKSFGKGSVQQLEDLQDGSSMRITIAKWLTPKGNSIHEVGLSPDIEVDLTLEDYENKRDPQLDRALEELKKEIKR